MPFQRISVSIRPGQKELCEKMGWSISSIWQVGLEQMKAATKDLDEFGEILQRDQLKERIFKIAARMQAQQIQIDELQEKVLRYKGYLKTKGVEVIDEISAEDLS